ncbi:NAD(P)H-dependent flavin oxidoreductase [Oceanobacillus neutriphilus]|uniref:Probable nitronate monooxygenase n=1 Tax=Oceanobacillus neutriphilus TaxID=531815 RepID=A0ABQ2NZR4_9BACI|nr:nitronate monooxygenase [Oceanobacillus neutriphilus]GGP14652.1 nitronate monooxygenase [Oceanobacillus neutriphilus]
MYQTRITKLLNIKYPIVQGGLAYLAYADLAAAVSNAGGLGQITAMSLPDPESLQKEIHKVKQLTGKPFGINFAIGQHGRLFEHMVQVAIDEQVPVVSITGGNPAGVLDMLKDFPIKTLVLVASSRQAQKAQELGADAVMVVGQEGGGHLGRSDTGTIVLTPHVVDALEIPVIASGGIVDGRGLMAALALGAEGIEMGTRFIATKEIQSHINYKQAILSADEGDTVVIKRSLGTPARALRSPFTENILSLEEKYGNNYEQLKDYISGEVNQKYIHSGNESSGFGWAGQGASRIHQILSVKDLISSIIDEADQIRGKWSKEV